MRVLRRAAVMGLLAMLAAEATARAQSSVDADIARGVALRRDGRDEDALAAFTAAWRASQAPRALAQMGLAEQALGRWVDAEAHLAESLGATRDPWIRAHVGVLQSALTEIRAHVGRLDVVGDPAGAEVVIDGRVAGTLPLAAMLRVPTGTVTFTVRRAGYLPATRTVQVDGGFPLRERVTLSPAVVAARPAPVVVARPTPALAPPPRRPPTLRYVGYALIGTGVATLAVSGAFLGVNLLAAAAAGSATPTSEDPYGAWARFQASENAQGQGTGRAQCDLASQRGGADAAQVRDLCGRLSTSATVSIATGIAGGALLVTGVIFTVVGRSRAPAAAAGLSLSPWIAANASGASLSGVW